MLSLFLATVLATPVAAHLEDLATSGVINQTTAFRLVALNQTPFYATATIWFPTEGRIEGAGPCNRYSADQLEPYPRFEVGPIAAHRGACPELSSEAEYFAALSRMTLIQLTGPHLRLTNDASEVMVFRISPADQLVSCAALILC